MGNHQQSWTSTEDRFGRRLRMEREQRGWTQADVATRLDRMGMKLHSTAIAKMEQRDVQRPRAIRLSEAQAIAELFNMTLDEMLSTPDSQFAQLAKDFTQLAAHSDDVTARLDQLFGRLRVFGPVLALAEDEITPEIQDSRVRIIHAMSQLVLNTEARQQKAEALLDAVMSNNSEQSLEEELTE